MLRHDSGRFEAIVVDDIGTVGETVNAVREINLRDVNAGLAVRQRFRAAACTDTAVLRFTAVAAVRERYRRWHPEERRQYDATGQLETEIPYPAVAPG